MTQKYVLELNLFGISKNIFVETIGKKKICRNKVSIIRDAVAIGINLATKCEQ